MTTNELETLRIMLGLQLQPYQKPSISNEEIQRQFKHIFSLPTPRNQMVDNHNKIMDFDWRSLCKLEFD